MKKTVITTALVTGLLLAAVMINAQSNTNMNKFEREWAEIENLRRQQLPQSLAPKVDAIYQLALTEKNYEQLIKAIIFQMNAIGILDENDEGSNRIFNNLKRDAETAPQPAKSILYSMIGQMYEEYYEQNRWTINSRTTANIELLDVRTWDNRKLTEEATKYYILSLKDRGLLQNEPIDNYKAFLLRSDDISYQPTLYDLLANRALNFYSKQVQFVTQPQTVFVINNPDYFADVQTFVKLNIQSSDTLSLRFLTLQTFQELLRFHLASNRLPALIQADIKRVSYLRANGKYADNEKLYEEALLRMSNTYKADKQNINVLLQLGDFYINQGVQWRHNKNEAFKSGYNKAFAIYERIEREYPRQLSENVKALKERIFEKELSMVTEGVQLPAQPFLTQVSFRNLKIIHKIIYPLTEEQAIKYQDNFYRYSSDQKLLADFIKTLRSPIVQEQIKLPSVTDYQFYTTEIKMSSLHDGFYLVILSDVFDWLSASTACATAMVQVSPLMALDRNVENEMTVIVTDRQTGSPVPDAKITTYQYDVMQTTFTGNKDGIAKIKNTNRFATRYQVNVGNKRLTVFNMAYSRNIYRNEESRAVIFTDRSIYRPGQTVYFKAILYGQPLDKDKVLLKSRTVKAVFRDVNWQVISEKSLITNDFGSIDGSFTIPQGILNGDMTIEFERYGSTIIRIEEYKRPTFEVTFNPVDKNFTFNEQVAVTANAKAYAGYPIDQAQVSYRVVRKERFPYYFWWNPPISASHEISSGTLQTDEKGDVSIRFISYIEDVNIDKKYFIYTVTVDVTDVNGETRSASINVNIGSKPLLVNTNLPENVLADKKDNFSIETTNLNGDFTPASVKVEITALKSPDRIFRKRLWGRETNLPSIPKNEFRKDFPLDPYGNEMNPDQLEVLRKITEYMIETADSKKLNLSAITNTGYYRLKLTAINQQGVTADYIRYFYFTGDKPEAISNMEQWLTIIKDTGEPGEQIEFKIAGGENNTFVYYELIHQGRIIESKWIKTGTKPVKVSIPIKEEYRGGFDVMFNMVQNNRLYSAARPVVIPYTNKMLDVKLATFRDRLLPGELEKWTMLVSDKQGEKKVTEIVASLYDASLDALRPFDWNFTSSIYRQQSFAQNYLWNFSAIHRMAVSSNVSLANRYVARPSILSTPLFANINWYDETYKMAFGNSGIRMMLRARASGMVASPSLATSDEVTVVALGRQEKESAVASIVDNEMIPIVDEQLPQLEPEIDLTTVATRTNFNETAFFYPKLRTNENGEVLIEFAMPEALTRWKLLSFAHTQDFKIGSYTNELITQKQVAISANVPRFFRENDVIELTAKVNNLADTDLNGQALLRLYDAATMLPLDDIIQSPKTQSFNVNTGGSTGLTWKLAIPAGIQAITYQVTAQAGTHTDGEEKTLPILTNSMLVTETMPFSVRAGQQKSLTFNRLLNNQSKTLRHHSLTLEYTSAPAWYAVQALPYIMEYPFECTEQVFSRYYANSLATTVVNKTPRIKQIFELWNKQATDALLSNLEKNQELKQVMLEETPWVLQAKNESERKKRIGLLFDLNRMSSELNRALQQLKKAQNTDGSFPWFEGNPSNRYITQHILSGLAHLKKLDALQPNHASTTNEIIQKGFNYLDVCIEKDYNELMRYKADMEKKQIGSIQLHYLYTCSFNNHQPEEKQRVAFDFFLYQTGQFWTTFSIYEKALAALVLHRNNQSDKAMSIIRSLREYAQQSEEMGMYWKDNVRGYFWHQSPIETQALLIEAFNEVAKDTKAVEEMKIWLLRNKQTNDWKTTKATSEAIFALLMTGGSLLDESQLLSVEIAGKPLSKVAKEAIKPEPGTGYVKTSWQGGDITPQMGRLKVANPNKFGIAWGGLYWQYFEQLDKITSAETSLRMNKQLFLRVVTPKGEELQPLNGENNIPLNPFKGGVLKVGDLVRVRMELRADRDYEFVHLKDMRASGFEPVNSLSGYRYQDGLWYYESIKDASTNFFISYLPKGTYVFEYSLRVTHAGDFSNGITTFQCMYAPEFSAHSEGLRITIAPSR